MWRISCVLILSVVCMMSKSGICELAPIAAGLKDAEQDVPRSKWFFAGCINGSCFFSDNTVVRDAKNPPEVELKNIPHLLGKPPGYVEKYIMSYQAESVRLRLTWMDYGWISGSGLTTVLLVAFLVLL